MDLDIGKLLKNDISSKTLQIDKDVEGTLIGRDRKKLYIDLSPFGTGVIYKLDLTDTPLSKTIKNFEIGAKVKAKIINLENEEGFVELSLKELSEQAVLEDFLKKAEGKELVSGKIIGANKGGLMVDIGGMTGFLPSSQLAPEHYPRAASGGSEEILKKLQELIGKELKLRILSADSSRQSFILSEKLALEGDLRKKLEQFKEGDVVSGEITGVTDFGAFVKFGEGLEGLVHISELDWRLISDPKESLKVGDKVKAKIIKIAHNEVSLSIKALKKDPWENIEKDYPVGKQIQATIREIHPFGAFAFLNDSIHGLAHISQFGSQKRMEQALSTGKEYEFEIISIESKDHRMGLKLLNQKKAVSSEPKKKKQGKEASNE